MNYSRNEKIALTEGKIYEIAGKRILIDEVKSITRIYVFFLDENNKVYGRRRMLGSLKNQKIKEID